MLLLQRCQCLLADLYLGQQRLPLRLERTAYFLDSRLPFLTQLLGQLLDQCCQRIAEIRRAQWLCWVLVVEFLQVAMNGGFRPGVAEFDTYRVDTGMYTTGQQRLSCLVHDSLVDSASGHGCSCYFVMWYVLCFYMVSQCLKGCCRKSFLRLNNHGLSHLRCNFRGFRGIAEQNVSACGAGSFPAGLCSALPGLGPPSR
ncbi:hypothetical protein D3C75_848240 [compost metagenome]